MAKSLTARGWAAHSESEVAQLCPTLCDPMDCPIQRALDSSVHGIFQARVLEWVAISFSRGIFLTQGSNPGLPHCSQTLYCRSHRFHFPCPGIWSRRRKRRVHSPPLGGTVCGGRTNYAIRIFQQESLEGILEQVSHKVNVSFYRRHVRPREVTQLSQFCGWTSSVQSLSRVRLCNPMDHSTPGFSITNSQSLLKFMSMRHWCHPTISSSVVPFSSCPQSFPAWFFQMSWFFASGGQSIGVSAPASVLPMNIQDLFPLGWTGCISLQSKGLSRVFSNTTVQKHQFFDAQLSL